MKKSESLQLSANSTLVNIFFKPVLFSFHFMLLLIYFCDSFIPTLLLFYLILTTFIAVFYLSFTGFGLVYATVLL